MDRCRCEDYAAAVKKLKFYTIGTYRPDIIDNYDRSQFETAWKKNAVSHYDLRFKKPIAWKKLKPGEKPEGTLPQRSQQVHEMWCPYMSPIEVHPYEPR